MPEGYKSKTAGFRRVVSENLGIRGSKASRLCKYLVLAKGVASITP